MCLDDNKNAIKIIAAMVFLYNYLQLSCFGCVIASLAIKRTINERNKLSSDCVCILVALICLRTELTIIS